MPLPNNPAKNQISLENTDTVDLSRQGRASLADPYSSRLRIPAADCILGLSGQRAAGDLRRGLALISNPFQAHLTDRGDGVLHHNIKRFAEMYRFGQYLLALRAT